MPGACLTPGQAAEPPRASISGQSLTPSLSSSYICISILPDGSRTCKSEALLYPGGRGSVWNRTIPYFSTACALRFLAILASILSFSTLSCFPSVSRHGQTEDASLRD